MGNPLQIMSYGAVVVSEGGKRHRVGGAYREPVTISSFEFRQKIFDIKSSNLLMPVTPIPQKKKP